MYVAERIKERRLALGWTQRELADKSGFHVSAISHYETGQRKPCLRNARRIAEALNVTIDDLCGQYIGN